MTLYLCSRCDGVHDSSAIPSSCSSSVATPVGIGTHNPSLKSLLAERDALRQQLLSSNDNWQGALNALTERGEEVAQLRAQLSDTRQQLDAVTRERDEARAAGAWKPSEVWREEVADRTAEAIAAWLDERSHAHGARVHQIKACIERGDLDEHGWAESYGAGWAQDIRAGAWRAKEGK